MSSLKKRIKNLPKSPGVYEFRDKKGKILYIGKATSLRDRVGSYFRGFQKEVRPQSDEECGRISVMISQIADIKFHQTYSDLEALILESNLIKKHQPKYNVEGKDDKSFAYAVITREEFPRVLIARETELEKYPISNIQYPTKSKIPNTRYQIPATKTFGPYTSKKQLEIALKLIRKIFPYHSAKQISKNCCFDFQIGLCPGPYVNAISWKDYLKNVRGLKMVLEGKKKNLVKELKKQMKEYAKSKEFEKAAEARNRIFALEHIQDVALIANGDSISTMEIESPNKLRIEGYDISNIGGDYSVGSMVVFSGNKPDKSQYRKFKIKTISGIDDVGMMREVLRRRFNNSWSKPDLIILDGGRGHLNMAERLLKELKLDIPVAVVAKGPTRKNLNIQYPRLRRGFGGQAISNKIPKLQIRKIKNIVDNKLLLANIMSEAHRFAISYHKKLRRKNWGSLRITNQIRIYE